MEKGSLKGKSLPDCDHVARYCRPKSVEDNKINSAAFEFRPQDSFLSVNWMEFFTGSVNEKIYQVYKSLLDKGYTTRPNGRFAKLNVGQAKERLPSVDIRLILEDKDIDPSHAGIFAEDGNREVELELANMISEKDIFPIPSNKS